jgi:hypothetical protein
MEIGKPRRTYLVEPIEEPVPGEQPIESPEPLEVPEPAEPEEVPTG